MLLLDDIFVYGDIFFSLAVFFFLLSPSVSQLPGVVGSTARGRPGSRGGPEGGVRREASNGAQSGAPRVQRAPRRAANDSRKI